MTSLGNIIKKEIKELLTISTILPIIIIALLFGSIGSSMEGIQESLAEEPKIGYINEDTGFLSTIGTAYLENTSDVVFTSEDISDRPIFKEIKQPEGYFFVENEYEKIICL